MSRSLFLGLLVLGGWLSATNAVAQAVVAGGGALHVPGSAVETRGDGPRASALLQPARLSIRRAPLATAMGELAERSGVWIAFSPSRLVKEGLVDCACMDLTVAAALDHLLEDTPYGYTEIDRHVVILPRLRTRPAAPRREVGAPQIVSYGILQSPQVARTLPVTMQQATVVGTVTDAATGAAISGATVQVEGGRAVATTNTAGQFMLVNVPLGRHNVIASMIGYSSQTRTINVAAAAETVTLNFGLTTAPLRMDQLVVTATGERRRVEIANVVGTVDAEALVRSVPITSMSQLLNARSPSVQVMSVAGTVGGQSRIRIRGQSSMSLSNDPIVYMDGIRVASGYSGGMDSASRLDDLNPAEIGSIDILKGPAAVALYGTDAANGVIIITTKRGRVGPPQWNVFVEAGVTEQPRGFPAAFYSAGRRTDNNAATQCLLLAVVAGTCVQDELRSLNILEDPRSTPFSTGRLNQTGVQLSGGNEGVRYFIAADFSDEVGTLRMPLDEQERLREERGVPPTPAQRQPNSLRAINLRTNVTASVLSNMDLDVSAGYIDRTHQFTTSGGSTIFALMRNGLQGRGFRDQFNGWWTYPAGDIFSGEELNEVGRLIGGIGATWRPLPWLATRARVGLDRVNEENSFLQRRGEGLNFSDFREGRKTETRIGQSNYTAELGATGSFVLSPAVELRSSVGAQYYRSATRNVSASGTILSPGSVHVGGTAVRSSSESNSGSANIGSFVEQVVGVNDRLFVTGSVRTDQNSAFGRDFNAVFYPRASVSWVPSQEPFFPEIAALSTVRLRLAYGASGVSPGTLHALRFFTSVQTFEDGAARPGLQFHQIGNVDLEPERTTEVEAGIDVDLFDGRAALELTRYRKLSRDALVNRPLAPSLGLNSLSRFENLGSVENQGWEGSLFVRVLDRAMLGWDVTFAASNNTNELVRLGEGVTPVTTFSGTRAEEGYPLWGRWARPIDGWEDTNGDGIISVNEVQVGPDAVFLGTSTPTRELSVNSSVTTLNGMLRVGALIDHRGGHLAYDRSEADRCTAATNCRAVNDPSAPLWEQARAVAASSAVHGRTQAGYFQDGAHTSLREASLSVIVPARYARVIGAGDATISLAGRNLHTWTGYTGISPEGSWVDNQGLDMNLVPLSRYWTIRINATY